jgi:hypothetical protein
LLVFISPFEVGLGTGHITFLDARTSIKHSVTSPRLTLLGPILSASATVVQKDGYHYAVSVGGSPPFWGDRVLVQDAPEVAA